TELIPGFKAPFCHKVKQHATALNAFVSGPPTLCHSSPYLLCNSLLPAASWLRNPTVGCNFDQERINLPFRTLQTSEAFSNEEDVRGKSEEQKKRLLRNHPDVDRVRRCHQNDLENVVPFVLVGLLYSLTGPDAATAITYFRVFAASRLCHTVAYVLPLPQPSRALSWLTGLVVTCCMAYRVLLHNFRL
uniref:Microsomal glutathione S-transferase 1 n=1 Tax=Gadus morhua TaxID=8049 RepID=A0A8C4ZIY0_GADMO